jgi:hypothetical protein
VVGERFGSESRPVQVRRVSNRSQDDEVAEQLHNLGAKKAKNRVYSMSQKCLDNRCSSRQRRERAGRRVGWHDEATMKAIGSAGLVSEAD